MRQDRLLYWESSWLAVAGSQFEPRYQLPLYGFFSLYGRNLRFPYFIFLLVSYCHVLLLKHAYIL